MVDLTHSSWRVLRKFSRGFVEERCETVSSLPEGHGADAESVIETSGAVLGAEQLGEQASGAGEGLLDLAEESWFLEAAQ